MNNLELSITLLLDKQAGRRWSVTEIADRLTVTLNQAERALEIEGGCLSEAKKAAEIAAAVRIVTPEQVREALENLRAQALVVLDDSLPPVNLRL